MTRVILLKNRSLSHRIQIVTNSTDEHTKALSQLVHHLMSQEVSSYVYHDQTYLWLWLFLCFFFFYFFCIVASQCMSSVHRVQSVPIWMKAQFGMHLEDARHLKQSFNMTVPIWEVSYVHFHKRFNGLEQFSIWCSATVCSVLILSLKCANRTSTTTNDKRQTTMKKRTLRGRWIKDAEASNTCAWIIYHERALFHELR